jgi:hypothetical protein
MTLGEALTNRADLQKRIAQLASRLQASGVVQEATPRPRTRRSCSQSWAS